jgi:hypothetical protein
MYYVNPNEVMRLFETYLDDYNGGLISKETAKEELQDALDSADCEWIDKEDGEA